MRDLRARWCRLIGIGAATGGLLVLAAAPFQAPVGAQTTSQSSGDPASTSASDGGTVAATPMVTPAVVKNWTQDGLAKRRSYDALNFILTQHDVRIPGGTTWSDADSTPSIDGRINPENNKLERNEYAPAVTNPALTQEIPTYLEGSTAEFRVRVYNRMGPSPYEVIGADATVTSSTDSGLVGHCNLAKTALPEESFAEYTCTVPDVRATGLATAVDLTSTINVTATSASGGKLQFQGSEPASINVVRADGSIRTEVRPVTSLTWRPADTAADAAEVVRPNDAEFQLIATNTGEVDWADAVVRTASGCQVAIPSLKPGATVTVNRTGVVVTGDPAAAAALSGVVPSGCVEPGPASDGSRVGTLTFRGVLGTQTTGQLTRTDPAFYRVVSPTIPPTSQPPTTLPPTTLPPTTAAPSTVPTTAAPTTAAPTTTAAPATTAAPTTAPPSTAPATVLGQVIDSAPVADLPVTGAASGPMALIGFSLLVVGTGLILRSRTMGSTDAPSGTLRHR